MTEAERKAQSATLNKQLDALEAAAKAATSGPWYMDPVFNVLAMDENNNPIYIYVAEDDSIRYGRDIKYIVTANPAVILGLIAALRQTLAERDWLAEMMSNYLRTLRACAKKAACPQKA